jgi:hypothetical protein
MEIKKPSAVITQAATPEEIAVKLITRNWKEIFEKLDERDQEKIQQDLVATINKAIKIERATTDKFIELTEHEVGIVSYYLYLLDKVKYMATEAFVENSKKKRDILLVEMAKILGANVVEESIPVPYKIKEVV